MLDCGDQECVGGVDDDDVLYVDEVDDVCGLVYEDFVGVIGEYFGVWFEDGQIVFFVVVDEFGQ